MPRFISILNLILKHIHLDSPNDEKVFMVAFRTIPEDSTGVAHILEHTSLCGSEKVSSSRSISL